MGSVTHKYGVTTDLYEEHSSHVFTTLDEIKKLSQPEEEDLNSKKVKLNRRYPNRKLIVFDLDETIFHCTRNDENNSEADVWVDILPIRGQSVNVGFNLRKSYRKCLLEAGKLFEVIAFTASVKPYADAILNHIDPENELFHHRFYRTSCIFTGEFYIKDLRIFEGVDLKDIVIVDNAVYSFSY